MLSAKVNVKKLNDEAVVPSYGSEYAAGADLYACISEKELVVCLSFLLLIFRIVSPFHTHPSTIRPRDA